MFFLFASDLYVIFLFDLVHHIMTRGEEYQVERLV